MAKARLSTADRLGIAWIVAAQGADGEAVHAFIMALADGLAMGEQDAITLHADLRQKYRSSEDEALQALVHLAETGEKLAHAERLLARHVALLKVLLSDPQNDMASRMVMMKIVREVEALSPA